MDGHSFTDSVLQFYDVNVPAESEGVPSERVNHKIPPTVDENFGGKADAILREERAQSWRVWTHEGIFFIKERNAHRWSGREAENGHVEVLATSGRVEQQIVDGGRRAQVNLQGGPETESASFLKKLYQRRVLPGHWEQNWGFSVDLGTWKGVR